jgi:predicted Zn-ribbon and HTH transcriptional regulator
MKAVPKSWYFLPTTVVRAAQLREVMKDKPQRGPSTSIIEPWRCQRCANEWTPSGSAAAGKCLRCHAPRPVSA